MIDYDALGQIAYTGRIIGKRSDHRTMRAIAHGLAYDPHIDGRLKLTPPGRARLEEFEAPIEAEPAQGSLL